MTGDLIGLIAATFIASLVEATEASTIVVALGTTRGWRPVLRATGLAVLLLILISALLGPAIAFLPLQWLRLVVGALLLVFGLQWLRKAILRAAGRRAPNDENQRWNRTLARAGDNTATTASDPYAFAVAFKSVLLEGLEIVFIVVTFGANAHQLPAAGAAAIAAVIVIVIVSAVIRGPIDRVPENTLKFVVGVMLTGFGTFWLVEGTGAEWPGGEIALPVVIVGVAALSLIAVGVLRTRRVVRPGAARSPRRLPPAARFLYDYIVGDDWAVALGILAGILVAFALAASAPAVAWIAVPVAVVGTLPLGLARAQR